MSKLTISQLEQYLSKAAWILKGPVDASDFKVYIFPLLFFKRISDVYKVENYVHAAALVEIRENDYNLNIPLNVEKIIEDNLPSVEEAMKDHKQAWQASQEAEERFRTILKKFIR